MQQITQRFRDTATRGGRLTSSITCTPPGGEGVELEWSAASVSCDLSAASRYSATLRLVPSGKFDVFELVTTPGARFAIDTGFDYRGGQIDQIGLGRYEVARDSVALFGGDISVDLVDDWAKLEREEFDDVFTPPEGLRSQIIAAAVLEVLPDVEIKISSDGGTYTPGDLTWDSRTALISDMANDGGLDCYFDATGAFVIRDEPTINVAAPVWTFRSGTDTNLVAGERERPFDKLFNRVAVLPIDETQDWAAQVVEITDPDHPLHKSKYGVSTYKYRSPTLDSAEAAYAAGVTILQRVQGTPETLSLTSFGMSALEAGDSVSVITRTSSAAWVLTATHLLESFNFDLATAGLTAATRSTDQTLIEEAA